MQKNQFFAVAAGVVVHQHTRVLMADLHSRGDGMSVEDVQTGLQQLAAELAAAYEAATVGPAEIQRVVVESASGPQGKATVEGRVAAANSQIAASLCDCAVCTKAAPMVRGQSRLSRVRTVAVVAQQVAQQVGQQAAMGGTETAGLAEQPAVYRGTASDEKAERESEKESK